MPQTKDWKSEIEYCLSPFDDCGCEVHSTPFEESKKRIETTLHSELNRQREEIASIAEGLKEKGSVFSYDFCENFNTGYEYACDDISKAIRNHIGEVNKKVLD